MALDNEAIVEQVAAARVSSSCPSLQSLAAQAAQLSQVFELTIQELLTEITNIINTGGGGATAPVYIIRALVNVTGGVPVGTPTFAFDGATDLFTLSGVPSGVTVGTAQNTTGRYLQDNEPVRLTSFNGSTWFADKLEDNVISARVNKPAGVLTGDVEFDFDNATLISGALPPSNSGVVVNILQGTVGNAYSDDEVIVLNLIESGANAGKWFVVQDDDDLGGGGGGGGSNPSGGWGIDADELHQNNIVSIDRRAATATSYDNTKSQIMGHERGTFKFRNIDVISIDLL